MHRINASLRLLTHAMLTGDITSDSQMRTFLLGGEEIEVPVGLGTIIYLNSRELSHGTQPPEDPSASRMVASALYMQQRAISEAAWAIERMGGLQTANPYDELMARVATEQISRVAYQLFPDNRMITATPNDPALQDVFSNHPGSNILKHWEAAHRAYVMTNDTADQHAAHPSSSSLPTGKEPRTIKRSRKKARSA